MMPEIVMFIGVSLGTCTVTSYRSVLAQTDSSPDYTSIGDVTHRGGIAASRDMLRRWGGQVNYGDYVYVEGIGIFQVNDCMGATAYDRIHRRRVPIKNSFDVWVAAYDDEKKFGVQHRKIYLLERRLR